MIESKLLLKALKIASSQQERVFCFKSTPLRQRKYEETPSSLDQLPLSQALRVKRAVDLLEVGKPTEAMEQIAGLSKDSRKHPLAIRVQSRCLKALRDMEQVVIQA
jgi:predicted Zn-dependent protease